MGRDKDRASLTILLVFVDLICLANSKKLGGWCVAGLRADGGGWVRAVAPDTDYGEFKRGHIRLQVGSLPQPLDLLRIPLQESGPTSSQPENWTISWQPSQLLQRHAPQSMQCLLRNALEKGPDLLGSRARKEPAALFEEQPATNSLALVAPSTLRWRRVRARRKCARSFS
jgi:hypothetical protein